MIEPSAARELLEAVIRGEVPARAELAERWPQITSLVLTDASASAALGDLRAPLMELEETFDDEGVHWIAMCLAVPHGEPFVAIEPDTRQGVAGRLSGIGDNFQLHVLLMDAFPGGGSRGVFGRRRRRVSARAAAIARGEGPQAIDEEVTGAWNPYVYAAYRDGRLPDPNDMAQDLWIWNEGTVADIPTLDGHRVVLLGPPSYERVWRAQRMFDVPASLEARELTADEVDGWLRRISDAAAQAGS